MRLDLVQQDIEVSGKGCLYGSEPARVPEVARFPEVNFTSRLHETFEAGWPAKTNNLHKHAHSSMRKKRLFYSKAEPARVFAFIWEI